MTRGNREDRKRRLVSADRRLKEHDAGGSKNTVKLPDGYTFVTIKKADTIDVDVIPYVAGKGNAHADPGEMTSEYTFYVHRNVGPNNETVVCATKTFGHPCYVCEQRVLMGRKGEDEELIKSLAPKERQLFNLRILQGKDSKVQILDQSFHLFGKYLDEKIRRAKDRNPDSMLGYYADPEQGFTLQIGITAKKNGPYSFYDWSDIEFHPRRKPLDDDILKQALCLEDLVIRPDYEEIKAMFLGLSRDDVKSERADDEEEDEEEEERPRGRGRSSARDEDEVVGERRGRGRSRDEEEEEEEEEIPHSRKGRRDDDDDDDEPHGRKGRAREEEEDEAPSKSRFHVGDLVIYNNEEYEVVRLSADGKSLTLEPEKGPKEFGISPDECERVITREGGDEEEEAPRDSQNSRGSKGSKHVGEEPPARSSRGDRKPREEDDEPAPPKGKSRGGRTAR